MRHSKRSEGLAVMWTESLRSRVHPRRGGVAVDVPPPAPVEALWVQAREALQARVSQAQPPDSHPDNLRRETQSLLARLSGARPTLDPTAQEDALALLLLRPSPDRTEKAQTELFVDLLFTLGGPVHATRALLLSFELHRAHDYVPGQGFVFHPRRGEHPNPDAFYTLGNHELWELGLARLRALLATHASDADYQAARDAAAGLQQAEDPRAAAAYLFPTESDWVRALALSCQRDLMLQAIALYGLSEMEPIPALLSELSFSGVILHFKKDVLPSLLDGLGLDGLPLFAAALAEARGTPKLARPCAEALAALDSDAAFELLLAHPSPEGTPPLLDAAVRRPHRALRLLSARARARGKEGDFARGLLLNLLRRDSPDVNAALADLPPEEHAVVTQLRAQSGADLPEAPPERLPPVLASPPWRVNPKPQTPPVLKDVTPPALEDTLAWHDGERETWLRRERADPHGFAEYTPQRWATDFFDTKGVPRKPQDLGQLEPAFFAYAPEALARHFLGEYPVEKWTAEEWLPHVAARLGFDTLALLLDFIRFKGGGEPYALLAPFASTRLAPQMADAFHRTKKSRALAREWLLRHPAHATAGLLVPALGKPGKDKDTACAALRLLVSLGHEATVLDIASRASPQPQVRDTLARLLAFDPLQRFPAKRPPIPERLGARGLAAPLLADRSARLPASAVEALVTMLSFSSLEEPYAGLEQVKAACDRASLARFAWELFELWLGLGGPHEEGWAFRALGLLGDDTTARELAALIRQWPGELAHGRALAGVEVLAALGTDVAILYLNRLAEKAKSKTLRQKLEEKIHQIAETRGLTQEELNDRIVPGLGLEAHGSLTLDFGPRSFTVGFDEQLRPFVRDAAGAPLKDLPPPGKGDDAEKATAAAEQWKALKKDTKLASALQLKRLNGAMCNRRRWSPEVFRQFLVGHPLLIHAVRRLVWGTYSPEGTLLSTFRVAEDRTFADVNEDTFTLSGDVQVGLPHALELAPKTARAWSQVLADYQLLQPFAQLGRPTHAPTAEEKTAPQLDRVKGLEVATKKVIGLESHGWRRGPALDGGVVCWMEKPLGTQWTAELEFSGGLYSTGATGLSPKQTLGAVTVKHQTRTWRSAEHVPLNQLDAILVSELLKDLETLRSR